VAESSTLDERYGRTPGKRLRDRRVLWIVAGAFAVILTAWVVWAGLEVSLPTGNPASCAVQALNETFTVVGWKVIDLPPSTDYTRSFTEVLHTTELSNTGLIYRCWLT
jgi:hypothetical protein